MRLVAPVSGSAGLDVKVPCPRVRMFPSHKASASASSHTPGPAAWPTGLPEHVQVSVHYNEVLELFTFHSLAFPKFHAQHLTISQFMA